MLLDSFNNISLKTLGINMILNSSLFSQFILTFYHNDSINHPSSNKFINPIFITIFFNWFQCPLSITTIIISIVVIVVVVLITNRYYYLSVIFIFVIILIIIITIWFDNIFCKSCHEISLFATNSCFDYHITTFLS